MITKYTTKHKEVSVCVFLKVRHKKPCRSSKWLSHKVSKKLDEEQINELREIFRSFDRNKDGSLTQLELGSLLRALGVKPSPDQLETLIDKADTKSNGLVEFPEFVALVSPELLSAAKRTTPYTEEQLLRLFRIFDTDGNGFLTAAELAHSMAKLGHALTVAELTGMIKEADSDGDGRINFQEFAKAINSAAFDDLWGWVFTGVTGLFHYFPF